MDCPTLFTTIGDTWRNPKGISHVTRKLYGVLCKHCAHGKQAIYQTTASGTSSKLSMNFTQCFIISYFCYTNQPIACLSIFQAGYIPSYVQL